MTPDEFRSFGHRSMEMVVRHPQPEDRVEWTRMRTAFWPESSAESHAEEIDAVHGIVRKTCMVISHNPDLFRNHGR